MAGLRSLVLEQPLHEVAVEARPASLVDLRAHLLEEARGG